MLYTDEINSNRNVGLRVWNLLIRETSDRGSPFNYGRCPVYKPRKKVNHIKRAKEGETIRALSNNIFSQFGAA